MNRRSFLALATTAPIAAPKPPSLSEHLRAAAAKLRRIRDEIRAYSWTKK